jgi:AAA15 family ATPase/GTPase
MLKQFEIRNYKNFRDSVTIDFSKVGGYKYNEDCISNRLISKMIIYGRNATGKTNLGKALMDISYTLSVSRVMYREDGAYLNADNHDKYAKYMYIFQFGNDELIYEYNKSSKYRLYDEKLKLNGVECFYYNFETKDSRFENLKSIEAETAIVERFTGARDNSEEEEDDDDDDVVDEQLSLSFLGWLINNTALPFNSVLLKLHAYVSDMVMLNPINQQFMIMRYRNVYKQFFQLLAEDDALSDFEKFLNTLGVKCKLKIAKLPDDRYQLYFKHNKLIPFVENASSGTLAITDIYRRFVMGRMRTTTLMLLDEFDAFYNYEMSEKLIMFLKEKSPNSQIIFTTHNTNLMSNRLMRPDCLFILSQKEKLTALCDATQRELREGHNLEKMYISGEFCKYE